MGLRSRRQERRDERRGEDPRTFRMRQKLVSIGDDYWIEDDQGERVYKVNGKALRIRETLIFEDPDGHELFKIQEKKLRIRDTREIEDAGGQTVATVKKALITPLRERFEVKVEHGDDLEAKGNIVDHEYRIERDGDQVAEVSKKWFRIADTYGVEVARGTDPALILAVTAVIDSMTHRAR
ncbi:MAG: LURP-one-related family protein [Nocardioides sp.]|nr:LURP-one-related family protein [Nocardioides sp.]